MWHRHPPHPERSRRAAAASRAAQIDALSGPNEFTEFYKRLKVIKDYHRRFPNEVAEPMEMEFLQMEKDRQDSFKGARPAGAAGAAQLSESVRPQTSSRSSAARRPSASTWT